MIQRITGRYTCAKCGPVITTLQMPKPRVCDKCGERSYPPLMTTRIPSARLGSCPDRPIAQYYGKKGSLEGSTG